MNKTWLVAKFEIIRQLKKPSFWVALLLLPVCIFAIFGLTFLDSYNAASDVAGGSDFAGNQIGITNDSGIYAEIADGLKDYVATMESDELAEVINIGSKEEGIEKIKTGELDIYYYLPATLTENYTFEIYHNADAVSILTDYGTPLISILKVNIISKLSAEDQVVMEGAIGYNSIALDSAGEEKNPLGEAIIPLAVLVIFYILICVFGNRLVTALTEEKENRISEMILTAVPAKNFVVGKIIALIALGFIQIAVFVIPLLALLIIYRDNEMIAPILSIISVEPWLLVSNILLLLVSYFFYAGSCTLLSSLMPTARDASNYFAIIMIGIIAPLFFMSSFMADTPNLLVYVLTYFPLSAPISLMFRNAFGSLPTYELIIGIVELALCSAGVLALTVKSFQKNAINFSVTKPNFAPRKSWKKQ